MVKIVDDCLPDVLLKRLQEKVMRGRIPWMYGPTGSINDTSSSFAYPIDPLKRDHVQELGEVALDFILDKAELSMKHLYRIRYALITNSAQQHISEPHTDHPERPHTVVLFYVNDSDGDTVIYNEKNNWSGIEPKHFTIAQTVKPKANRAIIFDGAIYHSSTTPVSTSARFAINYNIVL